jgi:hypothetical protein
MELAYGSKEKKPMGQVLRAFLLPLALLVPASLSFAQTGSRDIPQLIKTGQHLSIEDDQGRTVDGRIERIAADALTVSRRGVSVDVPVDRIVRIVRPDDLRNGMLVGLGIGVVLGTIGGASDRQGRGRRATFIPVSALGNGLICMGIGAALDAIHRGDRTIYQRPGSLKVSAAPVLGRRSRGVSLSLAW